jgi:hypothetical protein
MGIIILPFLLLSLIFILFAIIRAYNFYIRKEIRVKEIIFGILISCSIFLLICISYLIEGKAYALSPAFRIPIFMIILPFGFYLIAREYTKIKYLANLILMSIAFSGISIILLYDMLFGILDILGIEKYY